MEIKEGISIADYKKIRADVGWFEMSNEQIEKTLRNSDYIVSVIIDNEAVGMARCVSDQVYMVFIYDVAVCKAYQHRGIGGFLIQNIIDHYKKISIPGSPMQINLMAAKGVEEFYKLQGFKKYPNLLNGSGMGQWINGKPY